MYATLASSFFQNRFPDSFFQELLHNNDYPGMLKILKSTNDRDRYLLYFYAAVANRLDLLEWLDANNPNPNYTFTFGTCARRHGFQQEWTHCECGIPYYAIQNNNREMFTWALQKGFKIDECTTEMVARKGWIDILELLLQRGLNLSPNIMDAAIESDNRELFEWILKHMRLDTSSNFNKYALIDRILRSGNIWMYQRFDEFLNYPRYSYAPYLRVASQSKQWELVDYLLQRAEEVEGPEMADRLRKIFGRKETLEKLL